MFIITFPMIYLIGLVLYLEFLLGTYEHLNIGGLKDPK
jgi:hypothetical protein